MQKEKELVEKIYVPGVTLDSVVEVCDIRAGSLTGLGKVLAKGWHGIIRERVRAKEREPLSDLNQSLPTEIVPLGNDFVMIHGVVHSVLGNGSGHINNTLAEIVRRYVISTSQRGDHWFVEDGLEKDFGVVSKVKKLGDSEKYYEAMLDAVDTSQLNLIGRIGAFMDLSKKSIANYVDMASGVTFYSDEELKSVYSRVIGRIPDDHRALLRLVELIEMMKLPEPLDMEIGLLMAGESDIRGQNIIVDRSVYQARGLLEQLNEIRRFGGDDMRPIVAHLLCGGMHVTQVAYCLRNPSYEIRRSLLKAKIPL